MADKKLRAILASMKSDDRNYVVKKANQYSNLYFVVGIIFGLGVAVLFNHYVIYKPTIIIGGDTNTTLIDVRLMSTCTSYGEFLNCQAWDVSKFCRVLGFGGSFTSMMSFENFATCYDGDRVIAIPLNATGLNGAGR